MTKKEKNGLMDLISNFNSENQEHDVSYFCSVGLLRKEQEDYFLSLRFNTLIFSPDMCDLMSWCLKHNVMCTMHHYPDFSDLFFY